MSHRCASAFRNLHFVAIVEREIDFGVLLMVAKEIRVRGIDLALTFQFCESKLGAGALSTKEVCFSGPFGKIIASTKITKFERQTFPSWIFNSEGNKNIRQY